MLQSISNPRSASPATVGKNDPGRVRDAARQFEALLLAQILKSGRGPDSTGWLGGGEDQAGATATELAEEQFAQALARQGGLGLADMVANSLRAGTGQTK